MMPLLALRTLFNTDCLCSLDSLLLSGIAKAEHAIVVKEMSAIAEEHSADCDIIVTVQNIHTSVKCQLSLQETF